MSFLEGVPLLVKAGNIGRTHLKAYSHIIVLYLAKVFLFYVSHELLNSLLSDPHLKDLRTDKTFNSTSH